MSSRTILVGPASAYRSQARRSRPAPCMQIRMLFPCPHRDRINQPRSFFPSSVSNSMSSYSIPIADGPRTDDSGQYGQTLPACFVNSSFGLLSMKGGTKMFWTTTSQKAFKKTPASKAPATVAEPVTTPATQAPAAKRAGFLTENLGFASENALTPSVFASAGAM
jgi:hypothetical protein